VSSNPTKVCSRPLRRIAATLAVSLALLAGIPALAARTLPLDARFVKGAEFNHPYVKLGKETLRLAAGSKIYNEQNLIIMPAAAPVKANVLYKIDTNGQISQVWILSDEESQAYE
jgi:hypothetical protein